MMFVNCDEVRESCEWNESWKSTSCKVSDQWRMWSQGGQRRIIESCGVWKFIGAWCGSRLMIQIQNQLMKWVQQDYAHDDHLAVPNLYYYRSLPASFECWTWRLDRYRQTDRQTETSEVADWVSPGLLLEQYQQEFWCHRIHYMIGNLALV